jgi:hypothetical protein
MVSQLNLMIGDEWSGVRQAVSETPGLQGAVVQNANVLRKGLLPVLGELGPEKSEAAIRENGSSLKEAVEANDIEEIKKVLTENPGSADMKGEAEMKTTGNTAALAAGAGLMGGPAGEAIDTALANGQGIFSELTGPGGILGNMGDMFNAGNLEGMFQNFTGILQEMMGSLSEHFSFDGQGNLFDTLARSMGMEQGADITPAEPEATIQQQPGLQQQQVAASLDSFEPTLFGR